MQRGRYAAALPALVRAGLVVLALAALVRGTDLTPPRPAAVAVGVDGAHMEAPIPRVPHQCFPAGAEYTAMGLRIRAGRHLRRGKAEEALACVQEAVLAQPGHTTVWLLAAHAYHQLGEDRVAVALLRRGRATAEPRLPAAAGVESAWRRVESAAAEGDAALAAAVESYVAAVPAAFRAHAAALAGQRTHRAADVEQYERAADVLEGRARDTTRGVVDLKHSVLFAHPGWHEGWVGLAREHVGADRPRLARRATITAMRVASSNNDTAVRVAPPADYYALWSELARRSDNRAAAIRAANSALHLDPHNPEYEAALLRAGGKLLVPHPAAQHTKLWAQRGKFKKGELELIGEVMDSCGFVRTHGSDWDMLFATRKSSHTMYHGALLPHQRMDKFSGLHITRKATLELSLRRMREAFPGERWDFHPRTFLYPKERSEWLGAAAAAQGPWIAKPSAAARGVGVQVLASGEEPELIERHKKAYVVQEYVRSPMLIDKRKFTIRVFVVVTSLRPLRFYLHTDGLVRFCVKEYSLDEDAFGDAAVHLSNVDRSKHLDDYRSDPNRHRWTLAMLYDLMGAERAAHVQSEFERIARLVIMSTYAHAAGVMDDHQLFTTSAHENLGFDFLLDTDDKVWLLEVNAFPSMSVDSDRDRVVKGHVVRDLLRLVGWCPHVVPDAAQRLPRDELLTRLGLPSDAACPAEPIEDAAVIREHPLACLSQRELARLYLLVLEEGRSGGWKLLHPHAAFAADARAMMGEAAVLMDAVLEQWVLRK